MKIQIPAPSVGLLLLGVVSLCLVAPGCRRPSEEAEPTAASTSESPPVDEKAVRLQGIQRDFSQLRERLSRSSEAPGKKLGALRIFIQNAKLVEAQLGAKVPTLAEAERQLEEMSRAQEKEATEAYQKLEEQVLTLLSGSPPDPEKGGALVDAFPADRYKDSPIYQKVQELKAMVQVHGNADREAAARKAKLKEDDPIWNIALLEGFDPQYDRTPAAREIQALIKANYDKYIAARKAEEEVQKSAKWQEIDLQGAVVLWDRDHDCTKYAESVLSIGPNDPEYVKADEKDLNLAAGTCVRLSDGQWGDAEVRLEAQVQGGEGIFVGARGYEGPNGYNFSWKDLHELGIGDDQWHQLHIRINGSSMVITDVTGRKTTRSDRVRVQPGPLGVRVTGDKAVLRLRNMQAWVLTVEPSEDTSPKAAKKKAPSKKKKSEPEEKKAEPGEKKTGSGEKGK